MAQQSRVRLWFSKLLWCNDRTGRPKEAFGRPRLEHLETRLTPAASVEALRAFLPNAIGAVQLQGIDAQAYNVALPLIAGVLKQSPTTAARFLTPVQQRIESAFVGLDSTATNAMFKAKLEAQLGSLLVGSIGMVETINSPTQTSVVFTAQVRRTVADSLATDINLASNLGLSGLGIELTSAVGAKLKVGFDYALKFGYDATTGTAYIDTSASNELTFNVDVSVTTGSTLQGKVGALRFDATSKAGTGLTVAYTADVASAGGRITTSNQNAVDLVTSATLTANVGLGLTAQFGGSAINPKVGADFSLAWTATGNPETGSQSTFNTAPIARFDNVHLKTSDLIQGIVRPLTQNIRRFTAPLEPIANALNQKPLEAISKNTPTLREMLQLLPGLSSRQFAYFDAVLDLAELGKAADDPAGTGSVLLGNFNLADARGATSAFGNQKTKNGNALADFGAQSSFVGKMNSLNTRQSSGGAGLKLTFLDDPEQLLKLFVGNPADAIANLELFTFQLPTLEIGKVVEQTIFKTILAPLPIEIDVSIVGGLTFLGNLKVGYDGRGLADFLANSSNPAVLFNGFYIDTRDPLITITGRERNMVTGVEFVSDQIFGIRISASVPPASLNLETFVEKLGISLPDWADEIQGALPQIGFAVSGSLGLVGRLDVGLAGNNNKFRFADLGSSCIFEVSGTIGIGGKINLTAYAKASIPGVQDIVNWLGKVTGTEPIDVSVEYSYDEDLYTFKSKPLFTFQSECARSGTDGTVPPEVLNPQLATPLGDGTLRLNVGEFVGGPPADGKRQIRPTEINELYYIRHVSGSPTDLAGETIRVEAFGVSQVFTGVRRIYASAGDGTDQILFDADVRSPCELIGGEGDDTLQAGAGAATLSGQGGADTLRGSGTGDTIIGGDGNDTIDGLGGDDDITLVGTGLWSVTGGTGYDTIRNLGDVNFILTGDSFKGTGDASLLGVERAVLTGGGGDNVLRVSEWGGATVLSGLGGLDRYEINLVGAGTGNHVIVDSSGEDRLTVRGHRFDDDFVMIANQVTNKREIVTHSGIDHLVVEGGEGRDRFNVRYTAAGTTTTVKGGADSDLVRVSSNAGVNDDGNLAGILGALTIDFGLGGGNRLVVSNFGGAPSGTAVLKADSDGYMAINSFAPATIKYKADGNTGAAINPGATDGGFLPFLPGRVPAGYDSEIGVLIRGSNSGADTFEVLAAIGSGTTKVEGNGGNDAFYVSSDGAAAQGNLDGIQGDLLIDAGTGLANRLVVSDFGGAANSNVVVSSTAITGLAPGMIGYAATGGAFTNGTTNDGVLVRGSGAGADVFAIRATLGGSTTKIAAEGGDDRIVVGSDAPDVFGDLDAIAGYLTVDAGTGGGNRLIVSDFGGAPNADVTVTDARITGLAPATIDYLATGGSFTNGAANDGILLRGSNSAAGGDNFLILSTLGGSTTTIEGHGGADALNVGSRSVPDNGDLDNIRGLLTLVGGVGDDGIYINDRAKPGRANYTVAPDRVVHFDLPPSMVAPVPLQGVVDPPRPLFAGIRYDGSSERLRLDGSDDVNIFDVKPSVDTTYHLDGNLPPSGVPIFGGGDYLRLDTKGTLGRYLSISAVGVGQWRFTSPHKAVTFSSIERFNHVEKVATVFGNRVVVRDAETNKVVFTVRPYEPYFRGTVSAVMADIDFDGLPDLVVAPGTGRGPTLKVYNGTPNANGAYAARLVTSFDVFAPTMRAGVNLSAGDLNADGAVDVVVSAGPGWLPQVRAYDGLTLRTTRRSLATFNAFAASVRGGVRPVVADLDNDGRSEIVVGSGPGMSGTVSVFTGAGVLRKTFQPFGPVFRNGVNVAVGDVNRDGVRDLAVTQDAGGLPLVRVYDGRTVYASVPTLLVPPFLAFANNTRTGVTVAAKPTDGGDPGFVEAVSLLMGSGPNGGAVSRKVVQGLWSAGRIAVLDRIFEDASVNGIRLG